MWAKANISHFLPLNMKLILMFNKTGNSLLLLLLITGLLKIQTSQPVEFKRYMYTTRINIIKTLKREVFTEKQYKRLCTVDKILRL